MSVLAGKFREAWRRISRIDVAAVVLMFIGAVFYWMDRFAPLGALAGFLKFLGVLAAVYLFFRFIGWSKSRLLWSLRNRLIVAYVFIAVVPVLLLATLAGLGARILYSQLGGYLLYDDLQHRVQMLANGSEHVAAAISAMAAGSSEEAAERVISAQEHAVYDTDLPGVTIEFSADGSLLAKVAPGVNRFAGLLQQNEKLLLVALRSVKTPNGLRVVFFRMPVTPEFLATLAPDLGPVQLDLLEPFTGGTRTGVKYSFGDIEYQPSTIISARSRTLQPAERWLDPVVLGVSRFEAVSLRRDGCVERKRPVVALFSARPSRLNARIFTSLGEFGGVYVVLFGAAAFVFLLIELAALVTGVVLTRRITRAIADLYQATMYVQAGDLTHRVRIERRDQLGVLGESFNLMTSSIGSLIQEQKQRQRLENELTIAREVQTQLFPQTFPCVPGVNIEAVCRAARVVSGDYYDFFELTPTQVVLAIADISGKGISAALLMASLQAALRSQMFTPGSENLSTAELVWRLNNHLVRNTGDDRFATFFLAVYDSSRRLLRYTNAGHLPALCVCHGETHRLEAGGMVLGVVENYQYEEGSHVVAPGTLLIGYSDGLIEPENVYGEQFGIHRLEQAAIRVQGAALRAVVDSLMSAAEEWAGTPEQADDMTVIVARLG